MDIVVTVAASLVNTLTPGEDRGRPYPPPDEASLRRPSPRRCAPGSPRTGRRQSPWPRPANCAGPLATAFRAVFAAVAAGDVDSAARQVNDLIDRPPAPIPGWTATTASRGTCTSTGTTMARRPRAGRTAAPPGWPWSWAVTSRSRIGSVHRAALRPGVRGHLAQRHPPVLLHGLPEPGQGGGLPGPPGRGLTAADVRGGAGRPSAPAGRARTTAVLPADPAARTRAPPGHRGHGDRAGRREGERAERERGHRLERGHPRQHARGELQARNSRQRAST